MSTVTRHVGRGRRMALGLFVTALVLTSALLVTAAFALYAAR
ncbi:hypothetical protein ACFFS2_28015 [Streptomyces aurantiacus]|nr:hypothetical protein [Streptomyces aurantiacus]